MKNNRERMVYEIKEKYKLTSADVLSAMLQVPRHEFVDPKFRKSAYSDGPLPIGFGQTMSQPYTVAFMTDLLDLTGKEKVLEIGTGSGYQAAILSMLAKEVYTVEIIPELAEKAERTLKKLGYKNVYVKSGSGEWGWQEKAPFAAIIVTAGMGDKVPDPLFEQLDDNGVLVAPIGVNQDKIMTKINKRIKNGKTEFSKEEFGIFRFVPFVEEK